MVKRAFKDHRYAVFFIAVNTLIVVEEFARIYLYPPSNHHFGLGWYWTGVLSFPSSLIWYHFIEGFPSDLLSMVTLIVVGAFQWGIIGALLDRLRRGRSSAKT